MNITLFLNRSGLVWGNEEKRICCDETGILEIGNTNIAVEKDCVNLLPLLFYGATGSYPARFISERGVAYDLGAVKVQKGRIVPPPSSAVELMELHVRADIAETERDRLEEEIEKLKNIFDTNSLNFIIGGN